MFHSGMDVHSRLTAFHVLDGAGQRLAAGTIPTTEESLGEFCRGLAKATHFWLEASTSSAWGARVIDANGHRVTVVDPNRIRAISGSPKKTDASDAATLATLGRVGLLTPVYVRSSETDRFRRVLTARHALVRARANLIRCTRSLLRSEGHESCSMPGQVTGQVVNLLRIRDGERSREVQLGGPRSCGRSTSSMARCTRSRWTGTG